MRELSKEDILKAAAWQARKQELEQAVTAHLKSCQHWSEGPKYDVPNRDPQFPAHTFRNCQFCGREREL